MMTSVPSLPSRRVVDIRGADKRGHLDKQGGSRAGLRRFKRRYWVLRGSTLTYYKSKRIAESQGEFDLTGAAVTVHDRGVGGRDNTFSMKLCCGATLVLGAATPEIRGDWVRALRVAGGWAPEPGEDEEIDKRFGARGSDGLPVLLVLEAVEGPFKGQKFEIGPEGVTVGRNPKGISALHLVHLKQLQIPDDDVQPSLSHFCSCRIFCQVSRSHAHVRFHLGRYQIRDNGSLNGTFVNAQKLSAERKPSEYVDVKGGDTVHTFSFFPTKKMSAEKKKVFSQTRPRSSVEFSSNHFA